MWSRDFKPERACGGDVVYKHKWMENIVRVYGCEVQDHVASYFIESDPR